MTLMVPHTLYGMWEPCNCQWLLWSPHTLYGMQDPCNCQWLLWSPIPYMECRNLVTVNDSYGSPHTLYGMQEPCNCQWFLWFPPYLIWNRYLMAPHMYNLMVPQHLQHDFFRTASNLTVKYGPPLTLYGTGIVWSPTCMYGPPIYGIGTIWCPHMWSVFMSYMTLKTTMVH